MPEPAPDGVGQRGAGSVAEAADTRYQGTFERGIFAFRGIRYAAPPVGALRFAAPAALPPAARGVTAATTPGLPAPQVPVFQPVGAIFGVRQTGSEDCLTVDIRTPGVDDKARPVLVFIHGGGFCLGAGTHPLYGDGALAREGVVEVRVNYRLGILGFGYVKDAPAPANRGILDILAALKWVRRNIAAFGGDPHRVTLAGHSAGAMLAATLLVAPPADGLFSGVILQSGAMRTAIREETAAAITDALLGHPLKPARALTDASLASILRSQRRLSWRAALGLIGNRFGEPLPSTLPWQPTIGDDMVPAMPVDRVATAGGHVPVLTGTVSDEMWLMVGGRLGRAPVPGFLATHSLAAIMGIPAQDAKHALAAYAALRPDRSNARVLSDVATDAMLRGPAVRFAEARAAASAPTFDYVLDAPSATVGHQSATVHGAELPHLFDSVATRSGERLSSLGNASTLGARLRRIWVGFIGSGHPPKGSAWSTYELQNRSTCVITSQNELARSDVESERRSIWQAFT